jgi:two-component system nitrogen regulation response regulator NtrX
VDSQVIMISGHASVRVDVRVIAATNKQLAEEIRAGRFREDLFFRLNVIPVSVPPLRERGDDVQRLADHFMAEFATEYGRRLKHLAPDAQAAFRRYAWPGNVRELRNVIERLMIMVPGDVVTPGDLGFIDGAAVARPIATAADVRPLYEARDAWERDYILQVLAAFEGNMSRAADVLGVERSNLYRKMRGLGIVTGKKDDDENG